MNVRKLRECGIFPETNGDMVKITKALINSGEEGSAGFQSGGIHFQILDQDRYCTMCLFYGPRGWSYCGRGRTDYRKKLTVIGGRVSEL